MWFSSSFLQHEWRNGCESCWLILAKGTEGTWRSTTLMVLSVRIWCLGCWGLVIRDHLGGCSGFCINSGDATDCIRPWYKWTALLSSQFDKTLTCLLFHELKFLMYVNFNNMRVLYTPRASNTVAHLTNCFLMQTIWWLPISGQPKLTEAFPSDLD